MLHILIADDHEIVRKGLRQILLEEFPFAEIGEVSDGEELIARVAEGKWDIVLSDQGMPRMSGLQALEIIHRDHPQVPVLILSMYPADQYALRMLKAGAAGYVTKDMAQEELITAVHRVLSGKKYISEELAEKLAFDLKDNDRYPHELLSEREFTVMKLLAAGKSISEIASSLSLGVTTVSTYRSRILEKMNMKSNAEITRYALEHGMI